MSCPVIDSIIKALLGDSWNKASIKEHRTNMFELSLGEGQEFLKTWTRQLGGINYSYRLLNLQTMLKTRWKSFKLILNVKAGEGSFSTLLQQIQEVAYHFECNMVLARMDDRALSDLQIGKDIKCDRMCSSIDRKQGIILRNWVM